MSWIVYLLICWVLLVICVVSLLEYYSKKKKETQEASVQYKTNSDLSLPKLQDMDGHRFEYWCADLLRKNGFQDVKVTQASGDQGVDILAEKGGVHYAIQCKYYQSPLGNKPIQEVHTGKDIYHCHVGVVMTNSTFTAGAIEAAKRTNTLLWDGNTLKSMNK